MIASGLGTRGIIYGKIAAVKYFKPNRGVTMPIDLNEKQKRLLVKLTPGPLGKTEYLKWAKEFGIERPLGFIKELIELHQVEVNNEGKEISFQLIF